MWLLNCFHLIWQAFRMTQLGRKERQGGIHTNAGLFTYPKFVGGGYLLYQADLVPVN